MTASLVDVNLLVAILYSGHTHSDAAVAWLDRQTAPGSVAVCRVAEMGALRLMTRRAVIGDSVLSPTEFWHGWEAAMEDDRLARVAEPPGLTARWRALCRSLPPGATADTDAYLAAFAIAGDMTLATFDRGFTRFSGLRCEILG